LVPRPVRISPRALPVAGVVMSNAPTAMGAPVVQSLEDKKPLGIFCTGSFPMGTNIWVLLSDGTISKSENGEVQGVGEKFVKVNGWDKIPRR